MKAQYRACRPLPVPCSAVKGASRVADTMYPSGKYLAHVKSLVLHWPHLQLLVDFMDVGTTPVRWQASVPGGYPENREKRGESRRTRPQSHGC